MKHKHTMRSLVARAASLLLFACGILLVPGARAFADPAPRFPIDDRWERFPNPTAEGSRELIAQVWYPTAARSRALAPAPAGGHPVIVFLHGRGGFPLAYRALGQGLARRGFVVVVSDTARTDAALQRQDGKALFAALERANREAGSFFRGALDMQRVGLAGHSMGGGSTAHVLRDNPGYVAGFAFAPWQGGVGFEGAAAIRVPFGILHGKGDRTLDWRKTAKPLFDALPAEGDKFLYLLDERVTHNDPCSLLPFVGEERRDVYARAFELCAAFFERHLRADPAPLARLLDAKSGDPRLVRVYRGRSTLQ